MFIYLSWFLLLALSQASLLPQHLQSVVIDVSLRFGRSESIADKLASLSLPKHETFSNLTDLIYWLRLDRINADIEYNSFIDEHETTITIINDTIVELQTALNDHKRMLDDLDDDLRDIQDEIDARESDASEALSESRLIASIANDIVGEHAEGREGRDARMKEYEDAIQVIDRISQMEAIGGALTFIESLDANNDYVADCINAVHGGNLTRDLIMIRHRIGQKLDLTAAIFWQQEIRFNLTITEYRSAINEYRDEYDAIQDDIADLYDEFHQLNEDRDIVQADVYSTEELLQESKAAMKATMRAMLKEGLGFTTKTKVVNAELDSLNAAMMLVNTTMKGDAWPDLCQIGMQGCRPCLYHDQCLEAQLCSKHGQCIHNSVNVT